MDHPIIFFRNDELEVIYEKYHKTKDSIDDVVDGYFSNTTSINQLYSKVGLLENKQKIYDSFKDTALSIERFGKYSVKANSEQYVSPFSFNPHQSFDPISSKGGFYIGIGLLIFFSIALVRKWKIKKFLGFLVLMAFGLNLYNYVVKEPEFLNGKNLRINSTEYENRRMLKVASEKFADLYQTKTIYTTIKTYEYDVEGTNDQGDYIEGYVETSGKYGEGYIVDGYGDKISIEVEWTGNGELRGVDNDNNGYKLKVKD